MRAFSLITLIIDCHFFEGFAWAWGWIFVRIADCDDSYDSCSFRAADDFACHIGIK